MEENKIDPFQIIGFVILMAGLFWWIYTLPEIETTTNDNQVTNEISSNKSNNPKIDLSNDFSDLNSVNQVENSSFIQKTEGITNTNFDDQIIIENEDLKLKFTSKGGLLTEVLLKNFTDYNGEPLYMVKNGNQNISLDFTTLTGKQINTLNYFFKPTINSDSKSTTLDMVLSVSENQYLNFQYVIPKKGFMMDFIIKSYGFSDVIDEKKSISLNWDLKALRQAKSVEYENRYSQLYFQYDGDDTDYLSSYSDSEEQEDSVSWISYGQHFFNSILVLENTADKVYFESKKLFED